MKKKMSLLLSIAKNRFSKKLTSVVGRLKLPAPLGT
jgi:hypothetical protein